MKHEMFKDLTRVNYRLSHMRFIPPIRRNVYEISKLKLKKLRESKRKRVN